MNIGHTIKEIRKSRGFTQPDIEKLIGLSQGNLSRIESGKQGITVTQFISLCQALGVQASEIFQVYEGQAGMLEKLTYVSAKSEEETLLLALFRKMCRKKQLSLIDILKQ